MGSQSVFSILAMMDLSPAARAGQLHCDEVAMIAMRRLTTSSPSVRSCSCVPAGSFIAEGTQECEVALYAGNAEIAHGSGYGTAAHMSRTARVTPSPCAILCVSPPCFLTLLLIHRSTLALAGTCLPTVDQVQRGALGKCAHRHLRYNIKVMAFQHDYHATWRRAEKIDVLTIDTLMDEKACVTGE